MAVTTSTDTPHRRHRFQRSHDHPRLQITKRDVEIVRTIADHRFLRSTHICALMDASSKKIIQRLGLLYHAGYVDRPPAQLEYFRPGGGSARIIYAIANRGAQLLIHHHGVEAANVDWARKNFEAKRAFILHQLAVVDLRVALTLAVRARPELALIEPDALIAAMPAATQAVKKPFAWRVKLQHKGTLQEIGVHPDYAFALRFADGSKRAYLVECDRGTMPVERAGLKQTSIIKKLLVYVRAHKQKMHERHFNWKAFRVLIVTNTAARAANITDAIQRTPDLKNSELFYITDKHSLASADVLAYAWQHASGSKHTLI